MNTYEIQIRLAIFFSEIFGTCEGFWNKAGNEHGNQIIFYLLFQIVLCDWVSKSIKSTLIFKHNSKLCAESNNSNNIY